MKNEEEADRECVERCLHGDLDAFSSLMDRYQKPIFHAVLHMVGNYEDAREISQQAFLKAFEHLESYDRSHKFFSWIYRVAINESINHLHARRTFEPLSDNQPAVGNPAEFFEVSERSRLVREAVMTLSADYRAVIILRHFLHLSYAETAETLNVPEKTVRSRLYSARQLLRTALSSKGQVR